MRELTAEHSLADELLFPEGPRWRDGRLFVSDIRGERVVAITTDGSVETITAVPRRPSGLGWLPDGSLLVVSMNDHRLLRWDGRSLALYADLSAWIETPANDMAVARDGTAYVGSMGNDPESGGEPVPTRILRVDPRGGVCVFAEDVFVPNGMAITPDGKQLIAAETRGHVLSAFELGEDGAARSRRVFADLGTRTPDGIALDAEGAVWVACIEGHDFVRVLAGGRIDARVAVGERSAVACALGGEDGHTLFLLSVSDIERFREGGCRGRIETLRVGVPAAPEPELWPARG